jgi:hypothetical protein
MPPDHTADRPRPNLRANRSTLLGLSFEILRALVACFCGEVGCRECCRAKNDENEKMVQVMPKSQTPRRPTTSNPCHLPPSNQLHIKRWDLRLWPFWYVWSSCTIRGDNVLEKHLFFFMVFSLFFEGWLGGSVTPEFQSTSTLLYWKILFFHFFLQTPTPQGFDRARFPNKEPIWCGH